MFVYSYISLIYFRNQNSRFTCKIIVSIHQRVSYLPITTCGIIGTIQSRSKTSCTIKRFPRPLFYQCVGCIIIVTSMRPNSISKRTEKHISICGQRLIRNLYIEVVHVRSISSILPTSPYQTLVISRNFVQICCLIVCFIQKKHKNTISELSNLQNRQIFKNYSVGNPCVLCVPKSTNVIYPRIKPVVISVNLDVR